MNISEILLIFYNLLQDGSAANIFSPQTQLMSIASMSELLDTLLEPVCHTVFLSIQLLH